MQRIGFNMLDQKLHYDPSYLYFGGISGDSVPMETVDTAPWDADRPPVKVRFRAPSELSMSIGADKNDRHKNIMDGFDFDLIVWRARNGWMSGEYVRGVHVIDKVESGWWCATRR